MAARPDLGVRLVRIVDAELGFNPAREDWDRVWAVAWEQVLGVPWPQMP